MDIILNLVINVKVSELAILKKYIYIYNKNNNKNKSFLEEDWQGKTRSTGKRGQNKACHWYKLTIYILELPLLFNEEKKTLADWPPVI